MFINQFNLGHNPPRVPTEAQQIGDVFIEGYRAINYPKGGSATSFSFKVYVSAQVPMGGGAAGSQAANEALVGIIREMTRNRNSSVVYIRWSSLRTTPDDGWYQLESCSPDMQMAQSGAIPVSISVRVSSPRASRYAMYSSSAGQVATSYSNKGVQILPLPGGVDSPGITATRIGAEGTIPVVKSPASNPQPLTTPASFLDLLRGSCRVWDTINDGAYLVPSTDGTYFNTGWTEVFATDHPAVGSYFVSNGLIGFKFTSGEVDIFCWDNTVGTYGAWKQLNHMNFIYLNCETIQLTRLGPDSVSVFTRWFGGGLLCEMKLTIKRGKTVARLKIKPINYSISGVSNGGNLSLLVEQGGGTQSLLTTATYDPNSYATTDWGYAVSVSGNPNLGKFIEGFVFEQAPSPRQGGSQFGYGGAIITGDDIPAGVEKSYGLIIAPNNITVQVGLTTLSTTGAWAGAVLPSGTAGSPNRYTGTAKTTISGDAYQIGIAAYMDANNASATAAWKFMLVDDAGTVLASVNIAPNQLSTFGKWITFNTGSLAVTSVHIAVENIGTTPQALTLQNGWINLLYDGVYGYGLGDMTAEYLYDSTDTLSIS